MGEPKIKPKKKVVPVGLDLDHDGDYKSSSAKEEDYSSGNDLGYSEGTLSINLNDLDSDGKYSKILSSENKRKAEKQQVTNQEKTGLHFYSKEELKSIKSHEPEMSPEEKSEGDSIHIDGLGLDKEKTFVNQTIKKSKDEQILEIRKKSEKTNVYENLLQKREKPPSAEEENEAIIKEFEEFNNNLLKDQYFGARKDQYPRIMGDYFIYDHMADGGMAKICRGKYLGEHEMDGGDNILVVKMIKEEFSKQQDYIQMFMDEIDVAFNFKHPNISTMYDYGKSKNNLFVSMEYIHGRDLMDVINDLNKANKCLPVPIAVHVAIKMCEGLHYVHNFKDPVSGDALHIVHRDISPHNVMVSYNGEVKVIDFGIAKSDSSKQKEEEGTVKGKVNYFAPEYLEGKEIDHRYDQFAVGLTLWEMLTGKRTFDRGEQIPTLKAILDCNPAKASTLNKNVDSKLDEIILKCLSKEPGDRFFDMKTFSKGLQQYLDEKYPNFNPMEDLGKIVQAMYKTKYQRDMSLFDSWKTIALDGVREKLEKLKSYTVKIAQLKDNLSSLRQRNEVMFDFGFQNEVISVLNRKSMVEGLQFDMSSARQRRKERQKAARMKQMAIAAFLDEQVNKDSKANSQKAEKRKSAATVVFLAMKYTAAVLAFLFVGAITYNHFNKVDWNEIKLAQVKEGMDFDIHRAFRGPMEYRILKDIGFVDYETIVGREFSTEWGYLQYMYEKIMVEYIGPEIGYFIEPEIYISKEELERRELKDLKMVKQIKQFNKNKEYLEKLVEKQKLDAIKENATNTKRKQEAIPVPEKRMPAAAPVPGNPVFDDLRKKFESMEEE